MLLGTIDVGKTSLRHRFVEGLFEPERSVEPEDKKKTVIVDGKTVLLTITDTAGQEGFRTLTSSFYRNCDAIVVVFDLTSRPSFEDVGEYLAEAAKYAHRAEKFLVGNKSDLPHHAISSEEIQAQLEANQLQHFVQTSAKTGSNVDILFNLVAQELLQKRATPKENQSSVLLTSAAVSTPKPRSRICLL